MSEFASGPPMGSISGAPRNVFDPALSPSGSSSGSAIAIAAAYAPLALGTDTGGSIRAPAAAAGVVGLKTTYGLISRSGVVPLAHSFDTVGPITRNVADAAALLSVIAGTDPADSATAEADLQRPVDYTKLLDATVLQGSRLGVARDYMEIDPEMREVIESALVQLQTAGAVLVDVYLPDWFRDVNVQWYMAIMNREFPHDIASYLATLSPAMPKNLDDLIAGGRALTEPTAEGFVPNPGRWAGFQFGATLPDPASVWQNKLLYEFALPLVRQVLMGGYQADRLDALIFPTTQQMPGRLDTSSAFPQAYRGPGFLANLSGFPELSLPVGRIDNGLPVNLSLLGSEFSEPRLLALGSAIEQLSRKIDIQLSQ